ncbi:MAG: hypothetical protein R3F18_03895 [Lysobacterales bacterium]
MARELLRAVEPMAIELPSMPNAGSCKPGPSPAFVELKLQQTHYDAWMAERRYAACDPDNQLIAAQLERSWEAALQRVRTCEQQLLALQRVQTSTEQPDFRCLAEDRFAAGTHRASRCEPGSSFCARWLTRDRGRRRRASA